MIAEINFPFSGIKYPTANLFFTEIAEIKLSLKDWSKSEILEIRNMADSMIKKFDKYWNDIQGILSIATVLDPRYKMKSFKCYFPLIYGAERSIIESENVLFNLKSLVAEYELKEKSKASGDSSGGSSMLDRPISRPPAKKSRFEAFLQTEDVVENVKNDLDFYLEESLTPMKDDFNVLDWWKAYGVKFPILSQVARDIFAIPMSTVASESTFSTSGRVINPHRSRLLPTTLEALMCAQNWLLRDIQGNFFMFTTSFQFESNLFSYSILFLCLIIDKKSSDNVYMYYWDDGDTSDKEVCL